MTLDEIIKELMLERSRAAKNLLLLDEKAKMAEINEKNATLATEANTLIEKIGSTKMVAAHELWQAIYLCQRTETAEEVSAERADLQATFSSLNEKRFLKDEDFKEAFEFWCKLHEHQSQVSKILNLDKQHELGEQYVIDIDRAHHLTLPLVISGAPITPTSPKEAIEQVLSPLDNCQNLNPNELEKTKNLLRLFFIDQRFFATFIAELAQDIHLKANTQPDAEVFAAIKNAYPNYATTKGDLDDAADTMLAPASEEVKRLIKNPILALFQQNFSCQFLTAKQVEPNQLVIGIGLSLFTFNQKRVDICFEISGQMDAGELSFDTANVKTQISKIDSTDLLFFFNKSDQLFKPTFKPSAFLEECYSAHLQNKRTTTLQQAQADSLARQGYTPFDPAHYLRGTPRKFTHWVRQYKTELFKAMNPAAEALHTEKSASGDVSETSSEASGDSFIELGGSSSGASTPDLPSSQPKSPRQFENPMRFQFSGEATPADAPSPVALALTASAS